MLVAGIDVGSVAAKAVLFETGHGPVSKAIIPTGWNVREAGEHVLQEAIDLAGGTRPARIAATGYGRIALPFADKVITEITCHARGAQYLFPETSLILDIGGQDSKAISLNANGGIEEFLMNDKCAAGTGRFLQMLMGILNMNFAQLEDAASHGECVEISSQCTVFAETEIVGLLAKGCSPGDIACGALASIARRMHALAARLQNNGHCTFTGGLAQSNTLARLLEKELQRPVHVPGDPQFTGALGAALLVAD